MSDGVISLDRAGRRRRRNCPICGRPSDAARAPFCSRRCAEEDLARWLSGNYRIETNETPETGGPIESDDESETR